MAANTVTIALVFEKDFTQVALLTGYHLLGVGLAGILCVPTARIWGKRHLFILGNLLMIASTAWAGGSTGNWRSLVAARVFQGFALAPFEALVNACVGDLFFMHVSSPTPTTRSVSWDGLLIVDRSAGNEWLFRMSPSSAVLFSRQS